jgi:hypothetical protein
MIAREFQDTVPAVVQKITTLAHTLGKEHRIFNATDKFAEIGLEFENPGKESNMLLIQTQQVADRVQVTCSPWVKSWRGSRIVVPNLAQDEAMAYIRSVFIPALEDMYPRIAPNQVPLKTGMQYLLETLTRFWKGLSSLFDNLWTVGLWVLFIFLVFYLPQSRTDLSSAIATPQNQEISDCFCQQAWEKVPEVSATEEQLQACAARYICLGNAKASCLLQADRQWDSCEF